MPLKQVVDYENLSAVFQRGQNWIALGTDEMKPLGFCCGRKLYQVDGRSLPFRYSSSISCSNSCPHEFSNVGFGFAKPKSGETQSCLGIFL